MAATPLPVPLNVYAEGQRLIAQSTEHRPAPLPVPNPTQSFWMTGPDANPLAKEGSEGPLTSDADICIIGSGITGVSAAYHLGLALAQTGTQDESELVPPLKVVVLEARDFCSGATGRNGGHLAPIAFADFRSAAAAFGTDEALRWLALEKHTANSIVQIIHEHSLKHVDLVEGGRIELMFTAQEIADLKADYEAASLAGADLSRVELIDQASMKQDYGSDYPGYCAPAYNLWPLKFVNELYKLAAASPHVALSLHTSAPVTSITPTSSPASRRWSVHTPRGAISCTYVLHATNGHASHLLPHLTGPRGIIPVRGQIIATRAAVPPAVLSTSAWLGNEGLEYWFPRPLDESTGERFPLVILGGGREVATPRFELYVTDDSVINDEVGDVLRKFLPSVFPGRFEEGKEPKVEWTGIMGFTKSGDPFIGPVVDPSGDSSHSDAYKGQYIAAGYSGHGMPRAYGCGEAVAQMIVADIQGKQWTLPEWLPRHYVTRF